MKTRSIALVLGLSLVPGCSIINTRHDYDPAFDFSSLKSYAWIDVTADVGMNDLIVRRVRSALHTLFFACGHIFSSRLLLKK